MAVNFLNDLVQAQSSMNHALRTRMGSIGLDLVIAAVSERMAQEVPRSIQGDVLVQRAKSYVEANLSDVRLTPVEVAGAAGVSLRRLQMLFQERGHYVADWIWHRRLRKASATLADPHSFHLPIGQIAYACGFINQAHFSTRFRAAFGVSPRDYRQASFAGLAQAA